MPDAIIILIVFGAIAAGWLVRYGATAEKRRLRERMEALKSLAPELGLTLYPQGLIPDVDERLRMTLSGQPEISNSRFLSQFQRFAPFGRGHSQAVTMLIAGRRGEVDWALMDFQYKVTEGGESMTTKTYRFGVVVAKVPLAMPTMSLTQVGFFNRVGEWGEQPDLRTESSEFNARYCIRTADERATYELLHPQMIEYLMGLPVRFWQMEGPWILLHQPSLYDPHGFRQVMVEIEGFWERVPAYVREDRGWATQPPSLDGGVS